MTLSETGERLFNKFLVLLQQILFPSLDAFTKRKDPKNQKSVTFGYYTGTDTGFFTEPTVPPQSCMYIYNKYDNDKYNRPQMN